MDLTFAVESRCRRKGFDRTAIAILVEAFVFLLSMLERDAARDAGAAGHWSLGFRTRACVETRNMQSTVGSYVKSSRPCAHPREKTQIAM